jgi:hypothetical protein
MFCDLSGSTSLAAKLDAEDWRNLVKRHKAVAELLEHMPAKIGHRSRSLVEIGASRVASSATTLVWRLNSLPISAIPKSGCIQTKFSAAIEMDLSPSRAKGAAPVEARPIEKPDHNHRNPKLESFTTAL